MAGSALAPPERQLVVLCGFAASDIFRADSDVDLAILRDQALDLLALTHLVISLKLIGGGVSNRLVHG